MKKITFLTLAFAVPVLASAAIFNNVTDLIDYLTDIIRYSIFPLLISLAIIYFVWGIVKYIKEADDSNAREEGRQFMIYGIIALFVLFSFWGLIGVLSNTFGVNVGRPFIRGPGYIDTTGGSSYIRPSQRF